MTDTTGTATPVVSVMTDDWPVAATDETLELEVASTRRDVALLGLAESSLKTVVVWLAESVWVNSITTDVGVAFPAVPLIVGTTEGWRVTSDKPSPESTASLMLVEFGAVSLPVAFTCAVGPGKLFMGDSGPAVASDDAIGTVVLPVSGLGIGSFVICMGDGSGVGVLP
ncbi:MAG: hypothetical protein EOO77_46185 [Oxalobacteraceae bacterium]|nr:MAG: hypothetical protein EOO77_46185 [Oxalobacteraceae bacterium]